MTRFCDSRGAALILDCTRRHARRLLSGLEPVLIPNHRRGGGAWLWLWLRLEVETLAGVRLALRGATA